MSRSNPTENTPHPCTRWFEWDGAQGLLRYYDKSEKKNVEVGCNFAFILLDRLCTIKGWNDRSDSGIYSNEVKDSRAETLVVKAFKGGIIAEGLYATIKDKVNAAGGHFAINLYIAFYDEHKKLHIGSIMFKGGALGEWMEFEKANRAEIWTKAIQIKGYTEGKKGKVVFRTPVFYIKDVSDNTNEDAKVLDQELQEFLKGYFKRTRVEQVEQVAHEEEAEEAEEVEKRKGSVYDKEEGETDNDVPF